MLKVLLATGSVLAFVTAAAAQTPAPAAAPVPAVANVVPEPLDVQPAAGAPLRIGDGTAIVAPAGDAHALEVARYLSDLARRTRGLTLPVRAGGRPPQGAIVLTRSRGRQGEAYGLQVSTDGARITAGSDAGLFYGAVTLWQLMTADRGRGPTEVAPVAIEDAPRFAWRGLMVDSARHFQSTGELERIIDAMALNKLNVLHWHLTDDQGWRLQIKKYPRLTEVGAWRTPGPGSPDGPGRYGGFYTQDEVRRIVAYAAARHVRIVPEIEMPGHALSALLAYPELGAGSAPNPADQSRWGIFPYVYDLNDRSFAFLQDVLTEVMALFPGREIHVGGDEVEKERWNASPAAQARLQALGSTDPGVLQPYLTQRIATFLEAHGRRLVGWDEILKGGELPSDAVVTSWHGVEGGLAAAAKGHDAVLAPAPVLYFDNRQGENREEPPGRGLLVRLQDVYAFEPAPAALPPQTAAHIVGLQGNVWTEHIRTDAQLEAMIFPRLAAVAETGWSAPTRKDWSGFVRRMPAQMARYEALGVRPDWAALSVTALPAPGGLTLTAQSGGEIRYTLDGSEPTAASSLYAQPVSVSGPATLKAAAFLDGGRIGPVLERQLDAHGLVAAASQDLRLCNIKLVLNLEGSPGQGHRPYLVNPVDACWTLPGADLSQPTEATVTLARLPFNFSLDAGHNAVIVHPPRTPGGELEVRTDSCIADPVAIVPLPAGEVGSRAAVKVVLPPRGPRHDLCFTLTGQTYEPVVVVDQVSLRAAAATAGAAP